MEKNYEESRTGCFAWVFRVKKSVNSRTFCSLDSRTLAPVGGALVGLCSTWEDVSVMVRVCRLHNVTIVDTFRIVRPRDKYNTVLARFRNTLRKRIAREKGSEKPLTIDDLENETGSPDLIIERVLVSPRTPTPLVNIPSTVSNDGGISHLPGVPITDGQTQMSTGYIRCSAEGNPDPEQVKDYVQTIVQCAVDKVRLGPTILLEDNVSMTSSLLSDIAEAAVNASLTKLFEDQDDVMSGHKDAKE